jgi:small subunit ribosomal protein S17
MEQPVPSSKPVVRKRWSGVVVSDKMQKTRVVRVTRLVRHPRFEKVIRRSKKFKVHDPKEQSHLGDEVLIEQTRPISHEKRWRLVKVLRRNLDVVKEVAS